MSKIKVFFVYTSILIFAMTTSVYSQTEPTSLLNPFGASNVPYLQTDKDFLRFINSNPSPEKEIDYGPMINKMSDGLINTATSWTDIPIEINRFSKEENILAGYTLGFGTGVVWSVARGVSGACDIATLGVAAGDSAMKPEYKVDNPNQGFKINILKW